MQYDQFVGQVQHRARVASRGEAVSAIRATLETLSDRLVGGESKDLAAQLPREIGLFLRSALAGQSQRLSLEEFYKRVSIRGNVDLPKAIHHAHAVMEVLQEAVSKGEIDDIRAQLPAEFNRLFETTKEGDTMKLKRSIKIRDIETQHPEVINPEAGFMEAAQKMKKLNVGALPVCEGDRLIGLLTDRDITIRATAEGRDPRHTTVRDIMTPDVVCCYEDQDVGECAELMERKQIRRLPVMDREEHLVGVVSLGDVAVRTHNERLAGEILNRVSAQPQLAAAQ